MKFFLFLLNEAFACTQCSGEADGCAAMEEPDDVLPEVQLLVDPASGEFKTIVEPQTEKMIKNGSDGEIGFGMQFWDDRQAKFFEIKLLHDSQKHVVKQREVQKSDIPNLNVPAFALGIFNNNNKRIKSIEMITPGEINRFNGYSKDSLELLDLTTIKNFEIDNCWAEMIKINGQYHGFSDCDKVAESFDLTPNEENCSLLDISCSQIEIVLDGRVIKDLVCDLYWKCGAEKIEGYYTIDSSSNVKKTDVDRYVEQEIAKLEDLLQ